MEHVYGLINRSMNIIALDINMVDEYWSTVSPMIDKALAFANGEMELDDVHSMIEDGELVILAVVDNGIKAIVSLEIVDKPAKRLVNIMTAGGSELEQWIDKMLDVIEAIATEQQADAININGRHGWSRILQNYGYRHAYTVLTKEL